MSREGDVPNRLDPLTDDALVGALSGAAREIAATDAGPGPTPAVWHRMQSRLHARSARGSRPPLRGLLVMGAGVAAAFAVVMVARGVQRARPITYVVEAGAEQDGYIRGTGASCVQFSDGTHVDLEQGARVSVLSRGPRGARLRVEEGRARFDVAHLPRAAWSVEAGPYVVYVTGTVFDVRWSGSDEVIEVRMRTGSVQVGGPLLPERVTLRAGQHLTAKLASGELHIEGTGVADARASADEGTPARAQAPLPSQPSDLQPGPTQQAPRAEPAVAAPPVLPPSPPLPATAPPSVETARNEPAPAPEAAPAAAPAPEATAAGGSSSNSGARRSALAYRAWPRPKPVGWAPRAWSSAVTSGNAARVLAEADAHGLDRSLLEVDSTALVALADASRYSSRPELAVRALVAQRQRFPETAAAHTAAFLLGRLADDRGEVAQGLAWYRRYLSEMPNGPYAAEALGRKMLAVERISGRDAARSVAAEYVERFPNGTYMLQAHAILSNPTP
ncbi:MAG TPA: FecR domain-containing protein [Polyangia bacterium]|nr:FecR domain-containing protein [Polyangia bacterium]